MTKPVAIIWHYPSRGTFRSTLDRHKPYGDNKAFLEEGTLIRHSDMLGEVLPDRKFEGLDVYLGSVVVKCTHSLSRFSEMDKNGLHVWVVSDSQVLTDSLKEAADKDPEGFIKKFVEVEAQVREEKLSERRKED
jgi:hypothetical protein